MEPRERLLCRAGRAALVCLLLLCVSATLAFIDLSGSNKPHELRFEHLVFALLGAVLLLGGATVVFLVSAWRSSRGAALTRAERLALFPVIGVLAFPVLLFLAVRILL
ncbi:MAG: hypothetical protein AAF368_14660 [Planctomycetota bacterium]